ncbi:MAG: hypothetical protein REI09_02695 [Candidatus Dactylopiibacterium sp.]|nr:hypothetical protein [Candidatus Dactylopiibacterium sp.]
MTAGNKTDKPQAPEILGDFGQDDAFSTESHPEGLRYDEGPPGAPGSLPHPPRPPRPEADKDDPPDISIG